MEPALAFDTVFDTAAGGCTAVRRVVEVEKPKEFRGFLSILVRLRIRRFLVQIQADAPFFTNGLHFSESPLEFRFLSLDPVSDTTFTAKSRWALPCTTGLPVDHREHANPLMNVFKRTGRPGFYARWRIGGREFLRATGETTRAKAVEALHKFVDESRDQHNLSRSFRKLLQDLDHAGPDFDARLFLASATRILHRVFDSLPPEEQKRAREEIVREFRTNTQSRLRLVEAWTAWRACANRESEPKQRTLQGYEAMWKRFRDWATKQPIEFLDDLTRAQAETYAADLWNSSVSPSTFNQHIKLLRGIFQTLENRAGLVGNPWAHLKTRKRSLDEGRRNLTESELALILTKAEGNLRLMLHLGLFTGLRLGDVINLRWNNIEFDPLLRQAKPGFIVVVPLKTSRFQKKLELPIHPVLNQLLQDHRNRHPQGDQLFPEEAAQYSLNTANVSEPIQRFLQSCGLETNEKAAHTHRRRAIVRVGFHSLRHSFVSLCAKAKTPLHVVQKLVGHGSPLLTSDVYLHLDNEQKEAAIRSLPTITVES